MVECLICHKNFRSVVSHLRVHGITVKQYRNEFGEKVPLISKELQLKFVEINSGKNNPFFGKQRDLSKEKNDRIREGQKKYNLKKGNVYFSVSHKCDNCGEWFLTESRLRDGKLKNRFCCKKCSRSFSTRDKRKEINKKVSISLRKKSALRTDRDDGRKVVSERKNLSKPRQRKNSKRDIIIKICGICNREYKTKRINQSFCSRRCAGVHSGTMSAKAQKRRSKNEIYFFELCEEYFKKVLHNEPIFNGWDADVIIEDIKCAILWNGVWHYKKITNRHSLKQVQNRDKMKFREIDKCGYGFYVIKDMGKYDESFVEEKFKEFLKSLEEGAQRGDWKVGFTAGAWDCYHSGHALLLKDCKTVCDYLIVGLHLDPSIERPEKNKPIQTLEERKTILESIKYVDEIRVYETEENLLNLLKKIKPDIRIIGSDYRGREDRITGYDLGIPIHYHERNHGYSSTELRKRIYMAEFKLDVSRENERIRRERNKVNRDFWKLRKLIGDGLRRKKNGQKENDG